MVMLNKGKNLPTKKLLKRKTNPKVLRNLAIAGIITLLAAILYIKIEPLTYEAKQRRQYEQTIIQTSQDKAKLLEKVQQSGAETEAQKKQIEELNKKLEETQKLVDAKRSVQKAYAATVKPSTPAPVSGNAAKDYIYQKESGNNPGAINKQSGACGIGQAWPCSKMGCSLTDYACQDAYFTKYANDRYGGWQGAYNFWVQNHWW